MTASFTNDWPASMPTKLGPPPVAPIVSRRSRRDAGHRPERADLHAGVAGVRSMRYQSLSFNLLDGGLWGSVATLLGWRAGKALSEIDSSLTAAVLLIVAVSLAPAALELWISGEQPRRRSPTGLSRRWPVARCGTRVDGPMRATAVHLRLR